ncbi:hypothetical protein JCM3765_006950 [Sporobolomyces pararoseus]
MSPQAISYPVEEAASYDLNTFEEQWNRVNEAVLGRASTLAELPVSSSKELVENCLSTLPSELPEQGLGLEQTTNHLLDAISPALMPAQSGPRCFGLIIGGVTPASQLAESIVTSYDPCVQVHWPEATASVAIEALTLNYLLTLLSLPRADFVQNTLTTGATASNVLGLALGRNFAVSSVKARQGIENWSVPEDGFGGIDVDVFVVDAHASIRKAASLAGIGRRNVQEVGDKNLEGKGYWCCFDLAELEQRLKTNYETGRGSVVATSFGEVNSGAIARDTPAVRSLCDKYSAWLHCDAAFGAFAILHPDFAIYTSHLSLADSITSDAHKALNVPYDCGLFFSRKRPIPASDPSHVISLFDLTGPGSVAAAYLSSSSTSTDSSSSFYPLLEATRKIPSPLFMGIENSRRFRALPLYCSLLSLGSKGYKSLIRRQISFARKLESYLRSHPAYKVLTPSSSSGESSDPFSYQVYNIVLFKPSSLAPIKFRLSSPENPDPSTTFLAALNESKEIFVTGTSWRGEKAVRIAVSNWMTLETRDLEIVKKVLDRVMR